MQAIARETNLSETTFIERQDAGIERREGVRVRIFTTQEELPFARPSHPRHRQPALRAIARSALHDGTVTLALNVGPVPVQFEPQARLWPARGTMIQRDPEFGATLDTAEVTALTGLTIEDFDPARIRQGRLDSETAFAIDVPLRSAGVAGAATRIRQDEATAASCEPLERAGSTSWARKAACAKRTPQSSPPAQRARMQFNGGEDPATGSAAGCAIGWSPRALRRRRLRADYSTCARESRKSPAQAICSLAPVSGKTPKFTPQIHPKAKSRMYASAEAQFLLQKGGFSCRDAHAFNRHSHWQHAANSGPNAKIASKRGFFRAIFAWYSPLHTSADALSLGKRCRSQASKPADPAKSFTHKSIADGKALPPVSGHGPGTIRL